MTRKEAITILMNSNEYHHAKGELPHSALSVEAFNMAIEALKEPKQGEWIPCSERLPEEHGYYIVQTDGSHNAVIDIAEYGKFFRKPEYECVWEWNKASKIIAWMPLPEPYKEEGDKQ